MKQKTTTPTSKKQDKATAEVLKFGVDIHKSKCVVVCQVDGEKPGMRAGLRPISNRS